MMSKNDKQDNEVYILGADSRSGKDKKTRPIWLWLLLCVMVAVLAVGAFFLFYAPEEQIPEYYFEPETTAPQSASVVTTDSVAQIAVSGYIETIKDSVNDVALFIHTPHNAVMKLYLGMPDKSDSTIVFAAMAADIRKDNQQIVGDFVLSGKQLARGVGKKGFCAIEDGKVTIGIGEDTPLLQQAIDNEGSFFRQYPLVHNGELVENNPKNKAVRRALAIRDERIVMIESKNRESFHDFSQALIDIGVTDAIYLIGSSAYGWYRDKEHIRYEFGEELPELPDNISYIIWQQE